MISVDEIVKSISVCLVAKKGLVVGLDDNGYKSLLKLTERQFDLNIVNLTVLSSTRLYEIKNKLVTATQRVQKSATTRKQRYSTRSSHSVQVLSSSADHLLSHTAPQVLERSLSSLDSRKSTPTMQRLLPNLIICKWETQDQEMTQFWLDLMLLKRMELDGYQVTDPNFFTIVFCCSRKEDELEFPREMRDSCLLSLYLPQVIPDKVVITKTTRKDLNDIQVQLKEVSVHSDIKRYMLNLNMQLRTHPLVVQLLTPTFMQDLELVSKFEAIQSQTTLVYPDHVIHGLYRTMVHRIMTSNHVKIASFAVPSLSTTGILGQIVESTPVPV